MVGSTASPGLNEFTNMKIIIRDHDYDNSVRFW